MAYVLLAGLLLLLVPVLFALFSFPTRQRKIYGHDNTSRGDAIKLMYSPNELKKTDLAFIVVFILRKYLPGATQLVSDSTGFKLLPIALRGSLRLTRDDVHVFRDALSDNKHKESQAEDFDEVSPLFLVALTTPLLLVLLSHPSCPVKPLGAVNTRNIFTFQDSNLCCSPKRLIEASKNSQLSYRARMGGEGFQGLRKRRGMEFNILTEILCNGNIILAQELSFLQFLPRNKKPMYKEDGDRRPLKLESNLWHEKAARQLDLHIPANGPARWAASCKDYNPIHVSNLAAKAFGFASKIAHGNHAVALALESMIEDGMQVKRQGGSVAPLQCSGIKRLEVTFQAPIAPLPVDLRLGCISTDQDNVNFEITRNDKLYISGSLTT